MKLEFKGFTNPLTKEGVRALAIVLGVIMIIAAVVYATNFGKRKESTIVPSTPQPTITTKIPTITPLIKEATSSASPSPTRKVQRPTGTPTPAVKRVTVTPTPTI